jgi:hypothetical protein
MPYRGPGFLAFVRYGGSSSLSRQQIVSLPPLSPFELTLTNGRGGGGWGRDEPNHTLARKLGPL